MRPLAFHLASGNRSGTELKSIYLTHTRLYEIGLYFIEFQNYSFHNHTEKLRQSSYEFSFRRSPRGGLEEEQYNGSCSMILDISLPNMCDHWFWSLDGSSEFSVRSVRCLIDDALLPKSDTPTRWVKLIPIKVNVLAWKICFDRMPIRWWELEVPSLNSYIEWLNWLSNTRLSKLMKEILEGTCYLSWWIIWRHRNQCLFGSRQPRRDIIFDDIVQMSFLWISSRCKSKLAWDT
ncbi:hypothetical protein Tco_1199746 [Tanacetum coccineum]